MESLRVRTPAPDPVPPQPAAESGKRRRVISESHKAAVAAGVRRWHMKQGHKISTERMHMHVKDGYANVQRVSDGSLLMIVTQITPDMPSGSRTATVLLSPEQLAAILAPVGFLPVAS